MNRIILTTIIIMSWKFFVVRNISQFNWISGRLLLFYFIAVVCIGFRNFCLYICTFVDISIFCVNFFLIRHYVHLKRCETNISFTCLWILYMYLRKPIKIPFQIISTLYFFTIVPIIIIIITIEERISSLIYHSTCHIIIK